MASDIVEVERRLGSIAEQVRANVSSLLDWQRLNDKKACRIASYRTDFDPTNQGQWPQQHAWFLDQLERFVRAFRSRIDGLDIDALKDGSGAGAELALQ